MPDFGILFDERFKRHLTGEGHPERPARLDAVEHALEQSGLLNKCARIAANPIDVELLARVHDRGYIDRVAETCRRRQSFIDEPDSAICPESDEIARLAAGGVVEAARQIGSGRLRRTFCAVRPPGHHAERDRSMGFCLLNNVVIAARTLRDEFDFQRVLILDWDVHHGNGTQHLLEDDPTVLFISLHGHPDHLYPGTGYEHETGVGPGKGATLNIPLLPGAADEVIQSAFQQRVTPAVAQFEPEAILISAGFDAHADDPLGCLNLSDSGFRWMTEQVVELADRHAEGRVLSVLEGGYDLDVLRRCIHDHVVALRKIDRPAGSDTRVSRKKARSLRPGNGPGPDWQEGRAERHLANPTPPRVEQLVMHITTDVPPPLFPFTKKKRKLTARGVKWSRKRPRRSKSRFARTAATGATCATSIPLSPGAQRA